MKYFGEPTHKIQLYWIGDEQKRWKKIVNWKLWIHQLWNGLNSKPIKGAVILNEYLHHLAPISIGGNYNNIRRWRHNHRRKTQFGRNLKSWLISKSWNLAIFIDTLDLFMVISQYCATAEADTQFDDYSNWNSLIRIYSIENKFGWCDK